MPPYVAIGPNAREEELDAPIRLDLLLVAIALDLQIGRIAVEDVDVLPLDVDVPEEVLPHE